MYAILAERVCKAYRNGIQAVNELSLTVKKGEIFTLLGPNGAGKSTLVRILTTHTRPDSGRVSVLGKDILADPEAVRREIACVAQSTSIDRHLSLTENMMFQSRLYHIPGEEAGRRMERLIAAFGLDGCRKYAVASYSGGIRRRLDIALNMMSNPGILFLDEPTTGMDVRSRRAMWDMLKKIRDEFGSTIFMTTHDLEEADILSDTVCVMKNGREAVQGTSAQLGAYLHQNTIRVRFSDGEAAGKMLAPLSERFPHLRAAQQDDLIFFDTNDDDGDLRAVNTFLLEGRAPFLGIEIARPTLEDVFLRLTGRDECV